jgi:hypothetical protein
MRNEWLIVHKISPTSNVSNDKTLQAVGDFGLRGRLRHTISVALGWARDDSKGANQFSKGGSSAPNDGFLIGQHGKVLMPGVKESQRASERVYKVLADKES